jgi:hypothetical protein
MNFPGQLTVVNHTVEEDSRVGFFQQNIVHVTWELPTGKLKYVWKYNIGLLDPILVVINPRFFLLDPAIILFLTPVPIVPFVLTLFIF